MLLALNVVALMYLQEVLEQQVQVFKVSHQHPDVLSVAGMVCMTKLPRVPGASNKKETNAH
jgi:hypothetical protein